MIKETLITIVVILLTIVSLVVILDELEGGIYDVSLKDCEDNNGTLWTYSGCQKIPFFKSDCEFDGGYVCHLPNGTKYKLKINMTS